MTAQLERGSPVPLRAMTVAWVVVLVSLLVVLDTTVVNIALGALARDFRASVGTIQWVVTGYVLALATVIPITAWSIGKLGAKRVYLAAIAVFTIGSLLCSLAWDTWSLAGFRVLQGLGGGLLMPVGMTIVLRSAGGGANGRLMSMLGIPPLIGPIVGPVLGGLLVAELSWRWIFLVNLPLGLAGLLFAARSLPADQERAARRLDWPGLALLSPGLVLLVYGLTAEHLLGMALGALLIAGFVLRALTAAEPLLQLRLFARRRLAASAGTLVLFAGAYFGSMLLLPLYYQLVRGQDPAVAGLLGIPQVLATGVTMQVATRLVDRIPPGRIVVLGTVLAPSGFFLLAWQLAADTPYWMIIAATVVTGTGVGMTMMPATAAGTRGLSHAEAPAASTGLVIIQQVGSATGTAIVTAALGHSLATRLPGTDGLDQAFGLPTSAAPALAAAFQDSYLWGCAIMLLSLVPALFLPRRSEEATAGARRSES
ncbi:DHA2 family efflux MFS transporter permease subunit [Nonomuraea sp. B10E15]|uniref:DHA2 family efflux MFS transporter permease subunit n=1 Tax=Nonomuraea sp. B10E15 TaxID=3153560 RepID=UPI00325F1C44